MAVGRKREGEGDGERRGRDLFALAHGVCLSLRPSVSVRCVHAKSILPTTLPSTFSILEWTPFARCSVTRNALSLSSFALSSSFPFILHLKPLRMQERRRNSNRVLLLRRLLLPSPSQTSCAAAAARRGCVTPTEYILPRGRSREEGRQRERQGDGLHSGYE